ncbi:hypothetical protein [Henriciella aquimarina]|uniref:hypothetical protein n=1 Tax=Henriciella aquimarina TaxID=545261 RepID=UPI0009FDAD46|nr:hypothetical protein [Henriciella aquimarina]
MSAGEQAPCLGIVEAQWSRVENQTQIASNAGEADVIEIGEPFWRIELDVDIKDRAHFDDWDSFLARRRLHDLTFTIWRTFRPRPRDLQITSDIGLYLDAVSVSSSIIKLSSYGANRKAYPGDMISYITAGGGYWIGQVTEEATASAAGVIECKVWPRPVTPEAGGSSPRRIQALGEFRLIEQPRIREGFKRWSFRIEAEQVLR